MKFILLIRYNTIFSRLLLWSLGNVKPVCLRTRACVLSFATAPAPKTHEHSVFAQIKGKKKHIRASQCLLYKKDAAEAERRPFLPDNNNYLSLTQGQNKATEMEIRVLTLESGRDSSEVLYRLDTGQTLTFCLGATLIGVKEPKLWTNYPVDQDQFQRKQYHLVQWNEEQSGTYKSLF